MCTTAAPPLHHGYVLLLHDACELLVARAEGSAAGVVLAGATDAFEELVEHSRRRPTPRPTAGGAPSPQTLGPQVSSVPASSVQRPHRFIRFRHLPSVIWAASTVGGVAVFLAAHVTSGVFERAALITHPDAVPKSR